MATPRIFHFVLHWNTHGLFINFWTVWGVLESSLRTLEKSLTTSYPFHAKSRFCQLPQINYQGENRCGQTPNWLNQQCFFFPSFPCSAAFTFSSAPQVGCRIHHCLDFEHVSRTLQALESWALPRVAVQTVPTTSWTQHGRAPADPVSAPRELWNSFPVRARVVISEIGYGSIVTAWCHWGIGSEKVSVHTVSFRLLCVFVFTFIPPRVTFCSATTLQVPTTHSEEINLQAKKRKLDCYPSGTENDKRGWNGRKLFFAGHKQSVPSVCLSVSLAGNGPPDVYKGSVLSGELPGALGSVSDKRWHSRPIWLEFEKGRKMVDLLFTKRSDTRCLCQGRVWTVMAYEGLT